MRIQLLMTGSELMSGTTVDSNSARIADALATLGLAVQRKVTIGDDRALLVEELQVLARGSDVLIVNGGLGPTSDDLTAEALAAAAGVALIEHPAAVCHLEKWCAERRVPLNAANRKQAQLPEGCELLPNPVGSAVGFALLLHGCLVLCTPGVPRELEAMLVGSILPLLQQRFPACERRLVLRLHVFGLGESQMQEMIDAVIPHWPQDVVLGFRASMPTVEVKVLAAEARRAEAEACYARLQQVLADHVVATGNETLASALLDQLAGQGKTLATAESCTGGLIASLLTEVPGSSRVFTAGFVTYSNAMKTAMLGVQPEILDVHGAVSEPVVREMVAGALARSGSDYAVAVSGIAGPDGGTAEKPVGTVWIAWGSAAAIRAQCFRLSGPRKRFQQLVAAMALDLVRREALGLVAEPAWWVRWATN